MDDELRNAFATLSAQIATVGSDAREASNRSRETSSAVSKLSGKVERLERTVYGSNPPPELPPIPLTTRITEGEGSVAELTGVVLAVKGELVDHRKASEAYREATDKKLDEQTAMLLTISKAVSGVLTHPLTKKVGWAAAFALLAWFGAVQARLEAKTEQVSHDVARVSAATDAGAK